MGKLQIGDLFYRFDDRFTAYDEVRLDEQKFTVEKITRHGVWIRSWFGFSRHFVLLSARKKYAHPSREEARASFEARKRRQISILQVQLERAEKALGLAQNLPTSEGLDLGGME